MNVFIDTNVLIDYVCQRGEFANAATHLMAYGCMGKVKLQTSALSYVTVMYVARKYDYQNVKESLLAISGFVEVLGLQSSTVIEMLSSDWKDYEDSVLNHTAICGNSVCIVTRNVKDFKDSTLPVYTVEEFLKLLEEDDKNE